MLPTPDTYRQYGRMLGEQIGPVRDWYGFTQTARYSNIVLPRLRELAGYEDTYGVGTFGRPTGPESREALDQLSMGFREGATES